MNDPDPTLCPLCGRPNRCAMAADDARATACWCRDAEIPPEVLERVPEEARDRACVCRSCAGGEAPPPGD